jgi:hypothetical protein
LPNYLKITSTPLKIPHHGEKKSSIHEELDMKKFKNTFTKPSSSFSKTLITSKFIPLLFSPLKLYNIAKTSKQQIQSELREYKKVFKDQKSQSLHLQ